MKDTVAAFPGTFDPFTRGHENLVRRAASMFERIIVAVADSRQETLFPLAERVEIAAEVLRPVPNVEVTGFDCLLVDFLRQRDIRIVMRGVRTLADFEYEARMMAMNRKLYPAMETVFLLPAEEHGYLAASVVREIARHGGDVSQFVPEAVFSRLQRKFC
ncbi:MAG: pantetheine-phosphate adenylyltransferase [Betaproteobacteria bacterium]|jgi:pantetheine-phosphate adenylyltransferase|nr:pantetheine-phosphate adenylyltransferase [Betaproteobacteria bacterium]